MRLNLTYPVGAGNCLPCNVGCQVRRVNAKMPKLKITKNLRYSFVSEEYLSLTNRTASTEEEVDLRSPKSNLDSKTDFTSSAKNPGKGKSSQ